MFFGFIRYSFKITTSISIIICPYSIYYINLYKFVSSLSMSSNPETIFLTGVSLMLNCTCVAAQNFKSSQLPLVVILFVLSFILFLCGAWIKIKTLSNYFWVHRSSRVLTHSHVLALNQYIQLDFRRNPSSSLSNK